MSRQCVSQAGKLASTASLLTILVLSPSQGVFAADHDQRPQTTPAVVAATDKPQAAQPKAAHEEDPYVRKNRWFLGLTFSLESTGGDNTTGLLGPILNESGLAFDIEVPFGYFIRDYTAIGFSASYNQQDIDQTFQAQGATDSTRFQKFDYLIGLGPYVQQFLSIDSWGIFYLYGKLSAQFQFGESIEQAETGDQLNKLYSSNFGFSVGVQPGLLAILPNGLAFSVGVDLLGVSALWKSGRLDYEVDSDSSEVDVDFELNLLSLNLGVLYVF